MEDSCGAIWVKKSKKDETFLSIKIGDTQYVAFKNDKGDNEKRPDYKIYPSKPRDNQPERSSDSVPF